MDTTPGKGTSYVITVGLPENRVAVAPSYDPAVVAVGEVVRYVLTVRAYYAVVEDQAGEVSGQRYQRGY